MSSSSIRQVAAISSSNSSAVKSAGSCNLGAAGEVARAYLLDAVGLHHRDRVLALVQGDLAADRKPLAEPPGDLLVELVQAATKLLEPVGRHDLAPGCAHAATSLSCSRPLAKAWLHCASDCSA